MVAVIADFFVGQFELPTWVTKLMENLLGTRAANHKR